LKFINLKNRLVDIPINKYNIDWDRAVSKPQKKVKDFLFPYWQYDHCCEEFRIPNSLLRIDIINLVKKIIVEVSPGQHQKFNPFFHKDRFEFLESIKRDSQKRKFAELNNYTFIELHDEYLLKLSHSLFLEKFGVSL
jgi:hypothetical protein